MACRGGPRRQGFEVCDSFAEGGIAAQQAQQEGIAGLGQLANDYRLSGFDFSQRQGVELAGIVTADIAFIKVPTTITSARTTTAILSITGLAQT